MIFTNRRDLFRSLVLFLNSRTTQMAVRPQGQREGNYDFDRF